MNDNQRISELEKEVAYLKGRIDSLQINYPAYPYYYYPEQRPQIMPLKSSVDTKGIHGT